VPGNERGQDPPGRPAFGCRADVSNDLDARLARLADKYAMEVIMNVKAKPAAAWTCGGAVPIGVPEPGFVLGDLVNVERDDGTAAKSLPA